MKQKSTGVAYLLWLIGIMGIFGFHQFYLGNHSRGIGYIVTVGWFLIGSIIDLFTMSGQVRKANDSLAFRSMAVKGQQW